ncbi:MAG: transposase [Sulfurovum sp.]|nr:transposase [Sulfurovum sp.]
MPRKPRIEIPGYYHIINRGVERRTVYGEDEDFTYFLELLCTQAKNYNVTVHNYCLMSNHYHLLIQTHEENLSKFMRQVNANYAIYFNKKYGRVGHLWQGRYRSWYVTDEAYLYTLMLYIEQNPLKANMVQSVDGYPYNSAHYFLSDKRPECLKNSWIVEKYGTDTDTIQALLESAVDIGQLAEMKKASSLLAAPNIENKPDTARLKSMLRKAENKKERNRIIVEAYLNGYSQHMIAKVLDLNQATVQRIIVRTKLK